MANEQNLVRGEEAHKFTAEDHSKGGLASAEARRKKRDLRLACQMMLEMDIKSKDGKVKSGAEAIVAAQMQKALKGDAKAFEVLRDTAGQKPVDKVEQVNIDMEYEQSVEYVKELMSRREESSD